jgi:DNA mismatch repair protein MutS2
VPSLGEPVGELLERLVTDRPPLGGPGLVTLAALVRAAGAARGRIAAADPPCPELAGRAAGLADLSGFAREVAARLDRRGAVRDDATPELVRLRGRIQSSRQKIYDTLGGFVGEHAEHLTEDTIPMRSGRLMVMLGSGARGQVAGLTHGRSASGQSFYFEPLSVVEANNTLQQAVEDEEAERARILRELLAAARRERPALEAYAGFLGELDLLQAAAGFARRTGARLAEAAPRGELALTAARHPLLDPRLADLRSSALGHAGHSGEAVPLDAAFDPALRVLVITGPNAGGKTVALKTVGLLAAAHRCGLPVPAGPGSRIPFLGRIVATVGDDQDLLADRSTFSGRLTRLAEAWRAAGPDALLLLDELGSGTDPEEGAALGVALLEGILASGALAVITTHLVRVASAALDLDGADCAAMAFDQETGGPTFRLVPGPPGGSEALALARRLGLPPEWLARAEELLGPEHRGLQRLIEEVEATRAELAAEREAAAREAADAAKLRRRLEEQLEQTAAERRELGQRLRAELEAFRRQTLERLRAETERLRSELAAGRRQGVEVRAVERLFEAAPELPTEEPEPAGEIAVGGRVRHRALGWEGVLERLDRGRAEVAVRGKRVRCKADELAPAGGGAGGAAGVPRTGGAPRGAAAARRRVETPDIDEAPSELHLIGQRVEPALAELDAYLDRALLANRTTVRVVHGHGSGRLRKAVREHLRGHRAVSAHRPGEPDEGGDGATVVTLRG